MQRRHRRALATRTICKGKGSPYSITERRVTELIPVLGSQPAGDVSINPTVGCHYFPPGQYNTTQYKICQAPCCRGFRGAVTHVEVAVAKWLGRPHGVRGTGAQSTRDNHARACNCAKYSPISIFFSLAHSAKTCFNLVINNFTTT